MAVDRLALPFIAGGTIPKFTIVKPHSTAGQVVAGAAATDKLIGVSGEIDAVANDPMDVHVNGVRRVKYGGTVAVGDLLTSDASGNAVVTTTAGNRIVGIAMIAGVANDIGEVFLSVGSV